MSEKNNKYTPNLRFPEFSGEWEETKLGEVTRNEDSKRRPISKMDRAVGEYPYYGANGIQDHVNDYIFDGDYLLVGEDGSVLTKENTPVINWASGKFWVNNHAHVLSQKDDTSLKLISYLLSGVKIDGLVTGIPPKFNQDNLNTISIPLPPSPAEQQKIASCLSAMDDLIAAQAEKVEALKEKKTGLMQQLFPQPGETTPHLRFPEFTGEWEVKKLGEVAKIQNGYAYDSTTFSYEGDYVIRISDIQNGIVSLTTAVRSLCNVPETFKVVKGDILIAMSGATTGKIGEYRNEEKAYINQRVGNIKPFDINKKILLFLMQSDLFANYLSGILTVGAQPNISSQQISSFPFLLPPSPAEQEKIASCLSALDDQIAAETEKLTALKDYKKGLMQQLFPQPAK